MAITLTDVGNGTVSQLFSTINGNNDIIEEAINTPIGTTQIANEAVTGAKLKLDADFKSLLLNYCYPVGSYYWSSEPTSPATLFGGGMWMRVKGKVLVGVDENDTDFNDSGKSDGSKYLQEHSHGISNLTNNATTEKYFKFQDGSGDGYAKVGKPPQDSATQTETAGTGHVENNAGNMPPYITAYCWRRTG